MPTNVEIKARARDFARQTSLAAALADGPPSILEQTDTFFAVPNGRLKLREMPAGAMLISYRRPDVPGPKLSDYVLAPVAGPAALKEALSHALGVIAAVRKKRTLYLAGQTRIHLDEVEGLGKFIELEVVLAEGQSADEGQAVARELMRKLEVTDSDLLAAAYVDMLP